MNELDQYKILKKPFYQPQEDEIDMYTAAYMNRMPVMLKGPTGCGKSRYDEYKIGEAAIKHTIPVLTTISAAQAAIRAIRILRSDSLSYYSLQEIFKANV